MNANLKWAWRTGERNAAEKRRLGNGEIGDLVGNSANEQASSRLGVTILGPTPLTGDYLVESSNSLRRDVLHPPRLDASGLLWTFHCARSLNQDWGDLTNYTDSEDRGDLTAATASDDWGTLV